MALRVALVPLLTIGLGLCVALSFFAIGGREALMGTAVLERAWWLIYPLQALLAGLLLYAVARLSGPRLDAAGVSAVVLAAWLGQLVVLATGIVANELVGAFAVPYWVIATGGPIQPVAAIVGGLLGLRR